MFSDALTARDAARALLEGRRDPVTSAVEVMLSGFGYNFHDAKNRARANDQLVRARAADLLGTGAQVIGEREAQFRASDVPPSSREQPFPPAEVMAAVRAVDALRRRTQALASTLLTLEAPAGDRIWARLRDEHELLAQLLAIDIWLIARAHAVADACRALTTDDLRARRLHAVEAALAGCDEVVGERRDLFAVLA